MKTYNLDFQGYWKDANKTSLPSIPGVYIVSKGTLSINNKVTIEKIVYIGEAEDIHSRHNDKVHEHYKDFVKVCSGAEHVWYSCAKVLGGEEERKRVENAFIYKIQPAINEKGKDSFNYRKTVINSMGEHIGILDSFTVGRDWELYI